MFLLKVFSVSGRVFKTISQVAQLTSTGDPTVSENLCLKKAYENGKILKFCFAYSTTIKKKHTLLVAQKFFNAAAPTHIEAHHKTDASTGLPYPESEFVQRSRSSIFN